MGKASRWFRSLFSGGKKSSSSDSPAVSGRPHSRPSNSKSYGTNIRGSSGPYVDDSLDPNKHAIAVAAATAAVAEAALAAAHAAAEVVRLTNGGSGCRLPTAYYSSARNRRRGLAAVKIQSAFRAYLARRALRALKGLVKLQALVRGHIVRKQSADMLRRMQAMARVQARACANRACISDSSPSSSRSSHSLQPGISTPVYYDQLRARTNFDGSLMKMSGSNPNAKSFLGPDRPHLRSSWLEHWVEVNAWDSHRDTNSAQVDDEKSDKILEVDTWKPHLNHNPNVRGSQMPNQRNLLPSECLSRVPMKSQKPSRGLYSLGSMKAQEADQVVRTAESSPRVCSASSRPGSSYRQSPFTPAKSECSQSLFGDYLSYPSYMANTQSSRAKLRSHSAPRQRVVFEKPSSMQTHWDADTISERGYPTGGHFGHGGRS